ncbi:hypothetical protein ABZ923_24175 [Streptomyces sp. NPDC046881]|uniref:hypothetical protein n=1 Tax=Streptomyces sp. NPDC046881 TaxID=3155374 RepID=UPI0033DD1329
MYDDSPLSILLALLSLPVWLAVPVWMIAVIGKLVSVALPGRRPDWRPDLLRWSAWMAGWAAVMLYLLGAGSVAFSVHDSSSGADSTPAQECRDDFPPGVLVGQRASFVPLRFDCVLADGSTHPSSPLYFWANTCVVALALAAAALRVGAGRAAQALPGGPGGPPGEAQPRWVKP